MARLPLGFACDRAGIHNDKIALIRHPLADGFPFRKIQAASEIDDFDAQPKLPQSASPVNTCVAGPVIWIALPSSQVMSRSVSYTHLTLPTSDLV